MSTWLGQESKRTDVGKYECGNCGRWHVGYYNIYRPPMDAYEEEFVWTDWRGNRRTCLPAKHRRDPCTGKCPCS